MGRVLPDRPRPRNTNYRDYGPGSPVAAPSGDGDRRRSTQTARQPQLSMVRNTTRREVPADRVHQDQLPTSVHLRRHDDQEHRSGQRTYLLRLFRSVAPAIDGSAANDQYNQYGVGALLATAQFGRTGLAFESAGPGTNSLAFGPTQKDGLVYSAPVSSFSRKRGLHRQRGQGLPGDRQPGAGGARSVTLRRATTSTTPWPPTRPSTSASSSTACCRSEPTTSRQTMASMPDRPLEGRVALVSGANHGIGAATAVRARPARRRCRRHVPALRPRPPRSRPAAEYRVQREQGPDGDRRRGRGAGRRATRSRPTWPTRAAGRHLRRGRGGARPGVDPRQQRQRLAEGHVRPGAPTARPAHERRQRRHGDPQLLVDARGGRADDRRAGRRHRARGARLGPHRQPDLRRAQGFPGRGRPTGRPRPRSRTTRWPRRSSSPTTASPPTSSTRRSPTPAGSPTTSAPSSPTSDDHVHVARRARSPRSSAGSAPTPPAS